MNERDKELWDKSTAWDSADDGRGGLKIHTSVTKFAELIRADEREACAKLVDPSEEHRREAQWYLGGNDGIELLDGIAKEIRARKKTE